jgi:hypothetical protein
MELSKVSKEVKLKIADLALSHIKKVIANPEVKTDGDNFDYWNSFKLEDENFVDYNIYCGDDWCQVKQDGSGEYEYTDPSTWSFGLSLYGVNPPTDSNEYHEIDMDDTEYIFTYQNGEIIWEEIAL